ncbi:hypothetical protein SteCoe_10869 [Stentor coeruleus]|uniref:Uncharacterized protein n=1 Tax=Stentor coeruleus TaxID=5963 RepID=A0A1R2CEK9_9CILI|nr:hypothetical protein SteCoe_10869 [Stentor coeruleus]
MILHQFRKISSFIDPYSISLLFSKAKTSRQLLDHLEFQRKVFTTKEHAIPLIQNLKRLKDAEDFKQSLSDTRYKNFLYLLNNEKDPNIYLEVLHELLTFYNSVEVEVDSQIMQGFLEFLQGPLDQLNIKGLAQCLSIASMKPGAEIKKLVKGILDKIIQRLETNNPTADESYKIIVSCARLKLFNKELFYIFEPYIIRDSEIYKPKELAKIFRSYALCKTGSKDFIQNLLLKIIMKSNLLTASELSMTLKHICFSLSDKIFDIRATCTLLIHEIMKKIRDISEKDLENILKTLSYLRENNVHFYELLGIPFIKYLPNYSEEQFIPIMLHLAQGNLKSETCAKAIASALKPRILAQASAIQGSDFIEIVSPVGLIGSSEHDDFEMQQIKYSLFPELKKKDKRLMSLTIPMLYKETKHLLFDFTNCLNLTWAYLKISLDSTVKILDGSSFGLLIKLLNKHLSHLNSKDIKISTFEYDLLLQVKFFSSLHFPTIEKLIIPKFLHDYSMHKVHVYNTFLTEKERLADEDFTKAFEEFCQERFLQYYLPEKKYEKMDKKFYVGEIVVNVPGRVPGILIRHRESFKDGGVSGIWMLKIAMLGKVNVIGTAEWEKDKRKEYFETLVK